MSTHRHIDKICLGALAIVLVITILFMNGTTWLSVMKRTMGYETRLFDTSKVHSIEIVMDDWEDFIAGCEDEEYVPCTVIIDNEVYKNVGIRAKGNTSLSSVAASGSERYSFKIEFDHYDESKNYYGLDKISLNNIIQDNTYMKDYITYQLMGEFGVSAPLCSYSYITVNGEDWGLYLAVECVEESFLTRNYGTDYGELYKPDSTGMGGGRGNGEHFEMDEDSVPDKNLAPGTGDPPGGNDFGENTFAPGNSAGGGQGGFGSNSDVKLQYIDDDPDSYPNILDNAKTDIDSTDEQRLIASLKQLSEGETIEEIVDVESVIRYFVVHNFVCNEDSYTGTMVHNYYLYEKDGKLSMIPWDYNLAFGGFSGGTDATDTINEPIDTPVSGDMSDRPMIAWIFADEEYTELYHAYFSEFLERYENGKLSAMIDEVAAMIAPYVEKDPTKFCTYEAFENGVATLKEFCELRMESIAGQLDGTIPSTTSEQAEDPDSLIDGLGISISDMGSMNVTGGNAGMPKPGNSGMPEGMEPPEGMPQGMELPQGKELPEKK